ncbi:MAG: hypothetical protein A2126_00255 [Candidatus Woykebacteria bacterium GWB1_45_5]|uniref:histidine kinase n=2 Tax=Candidatus Woykeibacteriota TaxID=1817899 RepID=A0A1G1W3R4_9BACT|nr:MAG: hypothetical protein A2113_03055 [Candidatus Woykebacteria bacterium GWA1_44_8]OGY23809.1 MAG: hypothetical protein A2126_00255 [Candidatus Woykebacteria bacterium GWB1_45_5]
MLLDNYPQETERLRRYERFFEAISWAILVASYLVTFLPLGVPVHRLGFTLLVVAVGAVTFVAYRLLPFEKRTGDFRYTFKQKNFLLSLGDHLFATIAIFLTGGIESPFWFVYILTLIAGSLYLPAGAIVVESIEAVSLYLLTVAFLTPHFFGFYEVGFTAQMVIVPLVAVFATVLNYVVAKDLAQEVSGKRVLTEHLKEKATEAIGEQNKLRAIVTSVSDGIFVLDRERRLIFLNKAAENILGVIDQEVIGKDFDKIFSAFDGSKRIKAEEFFSLDDIEKDRVVLAAKDLKFTTNSKERWLRLTATEIKEGKDLGIGCICIFQDISEEKSLEQMKLDFVSIAAHELRTPLTAIRGYLSILMEEVTKKLKPEERSWLEKSFVSTTNLSALVENLLLISGIELQTLKLDMKETDWSVLLQEVVAEFKSQAGQKGLKLEVKITDKLPKLTIDKFRVGEVVTNLISNAITHTKPGGRIWLGTKLKDKEIVTWVKDTGVGIPKEALPHLFTKFFRVSGVLEQGSKGTGLGLYIAKSIIEMHKGRIWVESELGVGSTFSFALPVKSKTKDAGTKVALFAKKQT